MHLQCFPPMHYVSGHGYAHIIIIIMMTFTSNIASLVPFAREKGLACFEPFLGLADSTVQDPELSVRFEACDFSCDIGYRNIFVHVQCHNITLTQLCKDTDPSTDRRGG